MPGVIHRPVVCRFCETIAIQGLCGALLRRFARPFGANLTIKDTDITDRHLLAASPLLCYLFIFTNVAFGLFMVFCQGDCISATRNSNHPIECKHQISLCDRNLDIVEWK